MFPIDRFLHFDSGYRVLNGANPFSDFWTVSGPFINYMQAIFFYIFGVNWNSYLLHASFINASATLFTFFVLKNFKLNTNFCFLYSFLFSILAYTTSGTPFVDYHSAFFSLFGMYSLLLAINKKSKIYFILIPIFLGLAFLSKQVPAFYVILFVSFILILNSIINKKIYYLNYSFISSIIFILLILLFGKLQGIKLSAFIEQYILYPQTIGSERLDSFNFTFGGVFGHFKFIYFVSLPLFYIYLKKIFNTKKYIKSDESLIFLTLILFTFSFIFHQLLTKNQTFIFFLIPVLAAFSHIHLNNINFKFKNFFYGIIIFLCIFSVFKYHLRFNEKRKFHELTNVNFQLSKPASNINKKFMGLNWITPEFSNQPQKEIDIINQIKLHLKQDDRNKMLITNYTFFSAILEENLFAPSWAFSDDGTTHPVGDNKYTKNYSRLMIEIIEKNKILVIYIAGSLGDKHIYNYINQNCFKENLLSSYLKSFELKNCTDIKG